MKHSENYAQLRSYKEKLFHSLSVGDHAWSTDVLELSGRWEGDVNDVPLLTFDEITKWFDIQSDMAIVRQAMNIP
ncbi:hypothetical protein Prudu_016730 [Prunus dulcis]|uniref:Uncharacterized protein n=1 Tax=Prunus dulcis TaxID=3755 RepID=A0A4Y1RM63_PRUDU|nr:hypothetical protein Prudu_016730 [Prunus dulcis]